MSFIACVNCLPSEAERHMVHSMFTAETALLVIDTQESFRHRPYWSDSDLPLFVERLQALIDVAKSRKMTV
jgi:hypothetical protein